MTNREIKFRVWDGRANEFLINNNDKSIYFDLFDWAVQHDYNLEYGWSDYIFQQYVEAKDKNGKEIYDGDVVKIWHDSYTNRIRDYHLAVVIWHYNRWTVRTSSENPIKRDNALFFPNNEENIEVVGNISEHPYMVRI